MTKIGIAAVLLCCLLTTIASADDSYLCVADMATGFQYNKALDKWEISNFLADEDKYLVSRSTDNNIVWEVKRLGESSRFALCKEDFIQHGLLYCEFNIIFNMNKFNLRFIYIRPHGYYNSRSKNDQDLLLYEDGSSMPYIEIGKCSSVEKPH